MRNFVLFMFISGLLSALVGCDAVDELTKFDIDYESSVTVPATIGINSPLVISTPAITTNSSSTFENNNTRADLIESIKLKSMTLTLTSPNGEDFSFLENISLSISADGLSDKVIAGKTTISASAISIDLDVDDVELKEFLKKDKFTIKASATTDEVITSDHVIGVKSTFRVDAKIFGV